MVQETKILDPTFATKRWAGYEIRSAAAGSVSCGGMASLVRENEWVRVENAKVIGANVLSSELVLNKEEIFFAVGCLSGQCRVTFTFSSPRHLRHIPHDAHLTQHDVV